MKNLSLSQRRLIEEMSSRKAKRAAIARRLGVHPATVKRELERNAINGIYQAESAHQRSQRRKKQAGKRNQTRREYYVYDIQTLIFKAIRFRRSLSNKKKGERKFPYRKYNYPRIRFWRFVTDNRKDRGWRKIFRNWRYKDYKKWYNRKRRIRDYIWESFMRTPRCWWIISLYAKSRLRRQSKYYPTSLALPDLPQETGKQPLAIDLTFKVFKTLKVYGPTTTNNRLNGKYGKSLLFKTFNLKAYGPAMSFLNRPQKNPYFFKQEALCPYSFL